MSSDHDTAREPSLSGGFVFWSVARPERPTTSVVRRAIAFDDGDAIIAAVAGGPTTDSVLAPREVPRYSPGSDIGLMDYAALLLLVLTSLSLAPACGQRTTTTDAGPRARDAGTKALRPSGPPRPFVVRLTTASSPESDTRALELATSASGLAGPFRPAGAWDGVRDLTSTLPATFPNVPIAVEVRGMVRAMELERTLAALHERGVRDVTVHAEGERPLAVRVDFTEIDFLFGFNVLLRAAGSRWSTWTAGGMQAIWVLDTGPAAAADEAMPLGEQIRLRRPQRVIVAHGGGRGGVPGWMRRVRVACETCRHVGCECFVGGEPVVDNGAPAAPPEAVMRATVTTSRGAPPAAEVVRVFGGTPSATGGPVVLPALQPCAYRPQDVESARLSATITVDRDGFARDLSGTPLPFPMRCVADVVSRRTYPASSAQYRVTITAELTAAGHAVPRLIDRRQQRERDAERAAPRPAAPTTPTLTVPNVSAPRLAPP